MFDISLVHPRHLRVEALRLHADGASAKTICEKLSIPHGTVVNWLYRRRPRPMPAPRRCWRCSDPPEPIPTSRAYAYLLGQYLGDGHLALTTRVPVLRIACTNIYPVIMDECEAAMRSLLAKSVQRVRSVGCTYIQSYSMHWPCLLPQAGPGKKHKRAIVLHAWQREIVSEHAGLFARGLFHSDGSRVINRVTVKGRTYLYPRYFFYNESAEILGICAEALDRLTVKWRMNRRNSLSVADSESVSILDDHVGAKR